MPSTSSGTGSQRLPQRRSPVPEPMSPIMPPPEPPMSATSGPQSTPGSGTRSSSGSAKSSSKKRDPATQLSQIEKSVTHLLIATKQLLETLTQWSRHTATEGEVSDVYVRLGYEFNIACRAFTSIGVPTDDLGPVPDLLRGILEETLSQEASPASLDRFLPRIRDIIINLLHGLKKKQSKLRATKARESAASTNGQIVVPPARQQSLGGPSAGDGSLAQMLDNAQPHKSEDRMPSMPGPSGAEGHSEFPSDPTRASSTRTTGSLARDESESIDDQGYPPSQDLPDDSTSLSNSTMSSATAQNLPILSPEEYKPPVKRVSLREDIPVPPPPPKQQDALAALQRGGDLERRASRRYSAYQISRHLGASPGGVPMLPPTQNSPIPNRGRDVRESLQAVRTRGSLLPSRQRSMRRNEASPSRGTPISRQIEEESPIQATDTSGTANVGDIDSPMAKTPEDKLGRPFPEQDTLSRPAMSGTLNGPLDTELPHFEISDVGENEYRQNVRQPQVAVEQQHAEQKAGVEETTENHFVPEDSPQPGKELTLFLQYKTKIKKFVLPEGSNQLSMARLQLAFIEKFAWNTHSNGIDLPEIYIQDSVSGVRHELEDLSDVKDRSVLVLNVEVLDEVKRHITEGLGDLRKVVDGVRTAMDGHQAVLNQVSERQTDAAKEIARLATVSPPAARSNTSASQANGTRSVLPTTGVNVRDVQSLRRDLAIVRQQFGNLATGVNTSMAAIRVKAEEVKAKAKEASLPKLEGDSGRAYVLQGKKAVGEESEALVTRVDDLQDLVEDLRKDVVVRGVRPLPRQLENVSKDITDATRTLKKMQDTVKTEKPVWTKIWEKELEAVCTEREFLTLQEELIADLEDDIEKATETMALVEEATKQQNLQAAATDGSGQPVPLRSTSRPLPQLDTDIDPHKAKDGVLGEVRALQPNHENRLEAIERAERARQRELESRREGAAFKKELGSFIGEGKLKKSGGVEEAERLRKAKDERALRDEWESQQSRKAARAKARAEEKARMEAAAKNEASQQDDPEADSNDMGTSATNGRLSHEVEDGNEHGTDEQGGDGGANGDAGFAAGGAKEPDLASPTSSPSKRSSWLPAIFAGSSSLT